MGISPTATTPLDQLTRAFFDKFDTNRDAKIDSKEFSDFLGSMIASFGGQAKSAATVSRPAAASPTATALISPTAPINLGPPVPSGDGVLYSFGGGVSTAEPRPILYRGIEGMDGAKLANTAHRTVKYLFGRIAQTYDLNQIKSKADAETVLRSMETDFKAVGLNVVDYDGDKIKVKLDSGEDVWFDVVRACGSGNQAWQFLDTRS
jgi:hypothetical protein